MKVQILRKPKFLCLVMTLLIALSTFMTVSTSIYASADHSSVNKQPLSTVEQERFSKELENDLLFIMNNAVTYDYLENVQSINFDILYNKYGHTPELIQLENQVQKENEIGRTSFKRATIKQCATTAIQGVLGVSAVSALIGGGIIGLLQRKAAVEIAKLVAKYAVKRLAPIAVAGSLIWSFGRCMRF